MKFQKTTKFWRREISTTSEKTLPGFSVDFLVADLPQKISDLVKKNSLYSCQQWYTLVRGIWCVDVVGGHHEQETGLKCDFDSHRKKWTFGSESLLYQKLRRRREETAWKRRRIETDLVNVMFMLRLFTWVVLINCFWIELVLRDLYLTRFDLTTGLFFGTFLIAVWCKLFCCNHWLLVFESFSPPIDW